MMNFERMTFDDMNKDCADFSPASGWDWGRCDRMVQCRTGIARMREGHICDGTEDGRAAAYLPSCTWPKDCWWDHLPVGT